MTTKKQLEITLSKLSDYDSKSPGLEQYTTPGSVAAELAWAANSEGDVYDKTICDMGCGNGILGIAALLLGARKVIFVDIDAEAVKTTKKNIQSLGFKNYEIIHGNIGDIDVYCDTVFMNPPFGVQTKGLDITFFQAAMNAARKIYAVYKEGGYDYIQKTAGLRGFSCEEIAKKELMLKKQFTYHKSRIARTGIVLIKISR